MRRTIARARASAVATPKRAGAMVRRRCASNAECGCALCADATPQTAWDEGRSPRNARVSEVPRVVHEVLRSRGEPLDHDTRSFVEPRLGHDFSHVRVHTGPRAAASAHEVGALAYTVGQDVVFGAGQFDPRTAAGRRLLTHELVHVAQQGKSPTVQTDLKIGPPNDGAELEAERAADAAMRMSLAQSGGESPSEAASVAWRATDGRPAPLRRTPAPKFADCDPTRDARRIERAGKAVQGGRVAIPRAIKALSGGWAKMPAAAKAVFVRHFDPKGTGALDERFAEDVLRNFRKMDAEIQGSVVVECEQQNAGMCKERKDGLIVVAYTYGMHVHVCPAFETLGDPMVTIIHEIAHNALPALDRPYRGQPEYNQMTPRGSKATNIPIIGPIIRGATRKDTLNAPDAYAYFAAEVP